VNSPVAGPFPLAAAVVMTAAAQERRHPAVPGGGQLVALGAGGEDAAPRGAPATSLVWPRSVVASRPAARAAGNHSRGTDQMKDVAARADEETYIARVTVRSLYRAG
jgi:hypothetical protein